MSSSPWEMARRLLCIRLDSLGDVLMTEPAMRALKEQVPGRHLTLLTSPAGAQAANLLASVDDCIPYAAPWVKSPSPHADLSAHRALIEQLAANRYDGAVIFHVYSQNPLPAALCCFWAGIPLRLAHCRENPYQLLTDWIHDPEPLQQVRHEVERQLALVAQIGCTVASPAIRVALPASAHRDVAALLRGRGLRAKGSWIVAHPGASAPSRRYPPELFATALDLVARKTGATILLTGSAGEVPLLESIRANMNSRALSLAGQLSLAQLGALLAAAPLLIANNTGPVHLAAAVQTPVVDLYALTNPQHTPWQVPHRVLNEEVPCKYCYKSVCPLDHACLRKVSPARVAQAACELLEEARTHGAAARLRRPALNR